jgi:hypothetical protein
MADSPKPLRLSPRRSELASFEHAYAVAVQIRQRSGVDQFVVETGDPIQPYRTTSNRAANDAHILARVA